MIPQAGATRIRTPVITIPQVGATRTRIPIMILRAGAVTAQTPIITTPRIPGEIMEISQANQHQTGKTTEETSSQTIRLQIGKIAVEIINQPAQQTTVLTTNGDPQPILRHGVTCQLLRARGAMRIIVQVTLKDIIIVVGIGMEVMDMEETIIGVEVSKIIRVLEEATTPGQVEAAEVEMEQHGAQKLRFRGVAGQVMAQDQLEGQR
jgi:hypothetical protein